MALRAGTSSWSESSWVGPFYPPGTRAGAFLQHYATQFDTVEADTTYYRVPSRKLVDGWNDKTPDGFVLSAKFPRSVVHAGKGPRPDADKVLLPDEVGADVDAFLDVMDRLGPKCGPLVLQFPYFNKGAFDGLEAFLDRLTPFLETLPDRFRYAVEVRNAKWIDARLLDVLRAQNVALVLVDLHYMPHPASLAEEHDLITTDFSYVRLIGDRKAIDAKTETFDAIVLDQSPRLARWAPLIRTHLDRVAEVYAYANNHYAGHGPATIRDLIERVETGDDVMRDRFDHNEVFDADYLRFYRNEFTPEIDDDETELIANLCEIEDDDRVLDLACGYGRIANRLAADTGAAITGMDRSATLLHAAREDARTARVEVDYVQGDMRSLDAHAAFDTIVCWFTAFGYDNDSASRDVLRRCRNALKPGGRMCLETLNLLDERPPQHPTPTVNELPDGSIMLDMAHYDPHDGRIHVRRSFHIQGRSVRTTHYSIRLFTLTELRAWLLEAGFDTVRAYGGDGEVFALDSSRLILIADRGAEDEPAA